MDSQLSQDSLDALLPASQTYEPLLSQTSLSLPPTGSRMHSGRVDNMTPPPSTQLAAFSNRTKTPTPPVSHISTPPPTIETAVQGISRFTGGTMSGTMSVEDVESASNEQLRTKVMELQAAVQEAKMSAAHHKLQYQMLSQESAAALERVKMEASMSEQESRVIYKAEHARAATTPVQTLQEGTIPVHKELYQRMCRDIQLLRESNSALTAQFEQQQQYTERQDDEISSLTDKVDLMRQRIHAHRDQSQKHRQPHTSRHMEGTPRSVYSTPQHIRGHAVTQHQPQPFAALLQASEMASQESARTAAGRTSGKKGHTRNASSMSSLPSTPHRSQKVHQSCYQTPSGRHQPMKVPSTAPMPRTSAMRAPDVYSQQSLPMPLQQGPASDGTVSASDNENDSEAETDIIEQDDEVPESQASRSASQMLRTSQEEQHAKRQSFKGSGMLPPKTEGMRQTKLFGQVRKAGIDRNDGPPAKRARTSEGVGLGIAGVGVGGRE